LTKKPAAAAGTCACRGDRRRQSPTVIVVDALGEILTTTHNMVLDSALRCSRRAAWYALDQNPRRAGFRYRCLYLMEELQRRGQRVELFDHSRALSYDSVVFDAWSLFPKKDRGQPAGQAVALAYRLKQRGVRIILDNCDSQFAAHYLSWDRLTFLAALRLHTISLIPANLNALTAFKSSNRLVLSLAQGLAVIADPIPSYQRLSDYCLLGNWRESLPTCLSDDQTRWAHVQAGAARVLCDFSISAIADQWQEAVFGEDRDEQRQHDPRPECSAPVGPT